MKSLKTSKKFWLTVVAACVTVAAFMTMILTGFSVAESSGSALALASPFMLYVHAQGQADKGKEAAKIAVDVDDEP